MQIAFGIRARLTALSFALIGIAALVSGAFIEDSLRAFLESRIEAELRGQARVFAETLAFVPPDRDVDLLTRRLGQAARVRLTFVDSAGRVLADSDVARDRVAGLENHANRPEIAKALAGEEGLVRRPSATLGEDMMYYAVPAAIGGAARAATPLAEVQTLVSAVRFALLLGGAIALVVTLLMSSLASHLFTRSLRRLVLRARALSEGRGPDPSADGDELQLLAGSFVRMAEELKRALRSLAKERDRRETVLDGMEDAVFGLNWENRVRFANRAAMELFGVETAPVDRMITEVIPDRAIDPLLDRSVPVDKRARGVELTLPGKRGKKRVVHAQLSRLRTSRGAVLTLHDVTELRRLEQVRRDFVANVSHELRTPVGVIRANVEALLNGAMEEPERARAFLEAMLRNADRLSRLIADLLDLARIESGAFQPNQGPVRVADVVGGAADVVGETIAERDHEVSLELGEGIKVWADAAALEQILINFIENAAKYTPPQGHIDIRASRQPNGRVRIEVADDGPGVPEQHRARLFERFYRVDPGRSKEMGGTGLGLSIVKHLAAAMGGEVGMDPNLPQGSVFWIELAEPSTTADIPPQPARAA